ncbi:hypothetical protein [Timonella sp. A28]|uniref:hypothetical protein n=1 Tax=Timonella sp. A28 TaxID=3442640 RepID=UPI003EBBE9BA
MNKLEASEIVTFLNRTGNLWAMEGQSDAWADALNDVDGPTGFQAAREIARTRTSTEKAMTPGDIRKHVDQIRRQRLQGAPSPQPPSELEGDPMREKRWTRLRAHAIGNGLSYEDADAYADHHSQVVRAGLPTVPRSVAISAPPRP